jgi:hypothetical protein
MFEKIKKKPKSRMLEEVLGVTEDFYDFVQVTSLMVECVMKWDKT